MNQFAQYSECSMDCGNDPSWHPDTHDRSLAIFHSEPFAWMRTDRERLIRLITDRSTSRKQSPQRSFDTKQTAQRLAQLNTDTSTVRTEAAQRSFSAETDCGTAHAAVFQSRTVRIDLESRSSSHTNNGARDTNKFK